MHEATTESFSFPSPAAESGVTDDPLTAILRQVAQRLRHHAIEAEVEQWIDTHAHVTDESGHRQVVRNGRMPTHSIVTGPRKNASDSHRASFRRTFVRPRASKS